MRFLPDLDVQGFPSHFCTKAPSGPRMHRNPSGCGPEGVSSREREKMPVGRGPEDRLANELCPWIHRNPSGAVWDFCRL